MGKTPEADKQQADQYLRALLRYTENFYGAAIKHGMKAGETANCVAHIERAGKALHQLVQAWATIAVERSTPAEPQLRPFTPAQRRRLWENSPEHHVDATSMAGFERIVTLTERAHGITPPSAQPKGGEPA
jgi:hypothetical protein